MLDTVLVGELGEEKKKKKKKREGEISKACSSIFDAGRSSFRVFVSLLPDDAMYPLLQCHHEPRRESRLLRTILCRATSKVPKATQFVGACGIFLSKGSNISHPRRRRSRRTRAILGRNVTSGWVFHIYQGVSQRSTQKNPPRSSKSPCPVSSRRIDVRVRGGALSRCDSKNNTLQQQQQRT